MAGGGGGGRNDEEMDRKRSGIEKGENLDETRE